MTSLIVVAGTLIAALAYPQLVNTFLRSRQDFDGQSASEKMSYLWQSISENTGSATFFGLPQLFFGLMFVNLSVSFKHQSDFMPERRKKYIHSVGMIAKAKFVVTDPKYSGLFSTGCDNVLLRASLAKAPLDPATVTNDNIPVIVPAISIKFLRSGVASGDLMAMFSLDGQNSYNFFQNTLSNHIDPPQDLGLKVLAKRFHQANRFETMLGCRGLAEHDQLGQQAPTESLSFPFQLFFEPNSDVTSIIESKIGECKGDRWMNQFNLVPEGTAIYKVYALAEPESGDRIMIGYLKMDSRFTASKFADQQLFFKHGGMERDFEIYPEWQVMKESY